MPGAFPTESVAVAGWPGESCHIIARGDGLMMARGTGSRVYSCGASLSASICCPTDIWVTVTGDGSLFASRGVRRDMPATPTERIVYSKAELRALSLAPAANVKPADLLHVVDRYARPVADDAVACRLTATIAAGSEYGRIMPRRTATRRNRPGREPGRRPTVSSRGGVGCGIVLICIGAIVSGSSGSGARWSKHDGVRHSSSSSVTLSRCLALSACRP